MPQSKISWDYPFKLTKVETYLSLVVDVADLLDDEPEVVVPGQRLVHQVEVWKQ